MRWCRWGIEPHGKVAIAASTILPMEGQCAEALEFGHRSLAGRRGPRSPVEALRAPTSERCVGTTPTVKTDRHGHSVARLPVRQLGGRRVPRRERGWIFVRWRKFPPTSKNWCQNARIGPRGGGASFSLRKASIANCKWSVSDVARLEIFQNDQSQSVFYQWALLEERLPCLLRCSRACRAIGWISQCLRAPQCSHAWAREGRVLFSKPHEG